MGKCLCNPEIETSMVCMKDNVYLCEECLSCRNPEIYCKFRTACPIWFSQKHGGGWNETEGADRVTDAGAPAECDTYSTTSHSDHS